MFWTLILFLMTQVTTYARDVLVYYLEFYRPLLGFSLIAVTVTSIACGLYGKRVVWPLLIIWKTGFEIVFAVFVAFLVVRALVTLCLPSDWSPFLTPIFQQVVEGLLACLPIIAMKIVGGESFDERAPGRILQREPSDPWALRELYNYAEALIPENVQRSHRRKVNARQEKKKRDMFAQGKAFWSESEEVRAEIKVTQHIFNELCDRYLEILAN